MEQDNSVFNPTLGEIGCKFRSVIEDHIKENRLLNEDDVEWLLEPLDAISHSAGIVLGAFRWGDWHGWVYKLYCHQRNASAVYVPFDPPYEKYNGEVSLFDLDDEGIPEPKPYSKTMLVKGLANFFTYMAVPEVWDDLNIPFTEVGIWQAILLRDAFTFFPKGWHGNYNDCNYVYISDDMHHITDSRPKIFGRRFNSEGLVPYFGRQDIMPSVKVDGDKAVVTYCYWNAWSGFCQCFVPVEKHGKSVTFGKIDRKVLVKYDCGIRF